jgi:hypothetical protein
MILRARAFIHLPPGGILRLTFLGTVLAAVLCAVAEKLNDDRLAS